MKSKIKSFMTPFPYTIDGNADMSEATDMMAQNKIRHLPVAEDGKLVGLVTDRDIKWAMSLLALVPPGDSEAIRIKDVMHDKPYCVDLNERIDTVAAEMAERHIGSALVLREEKLAGIFTSTDACKHLAELMRRELPDLDSPPELA